MHFVRNIETGQVVSYASITEVSWASDSENALYRIYPSKEKAEEVIKLAVTLDASLNNKLETVDVLSLFRTNYEKQVKSVPEDVIDTVDQAYKEAMEEGQQAKKVGLTITSNPYSFDDMRAIGWTNGYMT